MRRSLFGLLGALCFVLGAGFATLWVRGEPRVAPPPPPRAPRMPVFPAGASAQVRRQLLLQFQRQQQIWLQLSMRSSPPALDLSKPMPRLPPFRGSQLRDVLDWLGGVGAGSIEPNWRAIEAAGIRPDTSVPRDPARSGTFGSALAGVLTPMGLAFASDGYFVYVSTPADVKRFGHMRQVDRFAFTTRADRATAGALDSAPNILLGPRPRPQFDSDWPALRAAGVTFHTPIAWQSYAPAGRVLETTLREASSTSPLRYQIQGRGVVISTAAALEYEDRHQARFIAISTAGFLAAFAAATFLARRRRTVRRLLSMAFLLAAASVLCVPIWRARPDAISARIGRSTWTVGLGPQRSFVLSKAPVRLEEVFLSGRSSGPGRVVYINRLGFYSASEGAPYHVFDAQGPRWAVIAMLGALPFAWAMSSIPGILNLRRRLRERRRARAGQCLRCGYELRGNPSDRCPECGAAAPKSAPIMAGPA
jgi:hypothetical protein